MQIKIIADAPFVLLKKMKQNIFKIAVAAIFELPINVTAHTKQMTFITHIYVLN